MMRELYGPNGHAEHRFAPGRLKLIETFKLKSFERPGFMAATCYEFCMELALKSLSNSRLGFFFEYFKRSPMS